MRTPRVDVPAAFAQQLLVAIPRLRRYARSLVFDASSADDLVQTALERALAHWHQFDQRRDILAWTLSILHNAHMDDRRRRARMPTADLDVDSDRGQAAERLAADSPDLGLRMDLLAALQRLPLEQREPLLLVTLEQFSYAECAELLRVPIGTVMSRISRARAALRLLLDGRPPAPAARAAAPSPTDAAPGLRRVI